MATKTSTTDVFINCPFDDLYSDIFEALIFTLYACGFRPRTAREIDDGSQVRIEKILGIISECRFGIHDISRTELNPASRLPRFNMPLELGIFLGAKRYGGKAQKQKRVLILDRTAFRYQRFISDLAGMDIHAHGNNRNRAMTETRNWLANVSRRQIPGSENIIGIYRKFRANLPAITKALDIDPDDIPYVDYERIVVSWLLKSRRT